MYAFRNSSNLLYRLRLISALKSWNFVIVQMLKVVFAFFFVSDGFFKRSPLSFLRQSLDTMKNMFFKTQRTAVKLNWKFKMSL